ncbi:hypothetical protein [Streptomyces sp. CO7]
MSENPTSAETPQEQPDVREQPDVLPATVPTVPGAPVRKPGRGRRIARVAGVVVLAAAVLGGTGFTVVTVRNADRDPGRPTWEHAALSADDKKKLRTHYEGLQAMLLTYEETGLERGPDLGEYGSDAAFTGKQAAELAKESVKDLPRTQRRRLQRQIDKERIKGQAMRSYANSDVYGEEYIVEIVLAQQENEKAVAASVKEQRKTFDLLKRIGFLRSGPKVAGHEKNAWCYLPELDKDEKIDGMYCMAFQGEVSVMLTADAPKPIDKKDIAGLMAKQLDRIETPGEAV